ncbi:MAG: TIM barrel protein [Chloroflexi bacterium]|nr:TIM barrel protein [Chloroflexota bacterium]
MVSRRGRGQRPSVIPERFAANVAWLFTEHAWLDRFAAARDAGFSRVEFPWPDDPAATSAAVADANLRVALINASAGDLEAGERGWPNDPARIGEWREAFGRALDLALDLGCTTINVLAGNRVAHATDADQRSCLEENLRWSLAMSREHRVLLVTELLNRHENPDYLLATVEEARPFLESLAGDGWKLQLDTWHLGLTDPDVAAQVRGAGPHIGHVQVADVPGRHEPGTGSLDWDAIASALRGAGYEGPIGLEYRPTAPAFDHLNGIPLG